MSNKRTCRARKAGTAISFAALLIAGAVVPSSAHAFTLDVVGPDNEAITGYRWLLEEDTTYHVVPQLSDPSTLAVKFHSSYMPVVARGDEATPPTDLNLDPNKHYFVSVLPDEGYTNGGAPLDGAATSVTVSVMAGALPTAQITVFVFEDNQPLNNAPDTPEETGLEGFSIVVEDAGGRYGMSAGTQMMDAWGNPLGTTYFPDGSVDQMGDGVILTDADGMATIKYLSPGKYGIQAIPPAGKGWVQTATIEGTKVIDAWVKADEPPYFAEFGPPGYHVFVGFIRPTYDQAALTGSSTLQGQVVNQHMSRPPAYDFFNGGPFEHTTPWVGLNDLASGGGKVIYAGRTAPNGSFSIPNVPPGNYELVIWDDALDLIFATLGVTVNPDGTCITPGGSCDFGDIPVFQWFGRLENWVFNDLNENGFRDPGEMGMPEQAINIRWRDGTMYQSFPTDGEGFVPFDQVFPFFSWLIAEVDFARFKATGVTVVVDDGGPISPDMGWDYPSYDVLTPQAQFEADGVTPAINPHTGNNLSRTEAGPALVEAFQLFLGQTHVLEWGKAAYGDPDVDNPPYGDFPGPGDVDHNENGEFDHGNGGISGVVYYSTTRGEDDPRYGGAEPWEPGIPRVTVRLWDASHTTLLNEVQTDSWDDSQPTGCQGEKFVYRDAQTDCYDGLRNFSQVRPGVFDGGYAIDSRFLPSFDSPDAVEVPGLPPGPYVVEVIPPEGYDIVKEEDKNVDFGDEYAPSLLAKPPECVNYDDNGGLGHLVPDELALFPGVEAYYGGQYRPVCDRKLVYLSDGQNAAADFYLFTEVPIAGHIIGFILDDTANEFDVTAPTFGEKYAPPWLPVSIRDQSGREISRVYSDEFGVYNAVVPSTFTANQPKPSGMVPNMISVCLNDPAIPNPDYDSNTPGSVQFFPDPNFNTQYSQYCYTFQYMPGTTTYLDTPVLPIAAFAGPGQYPLDCEYTDGTPRIYSVSGPGGGPYVPAVGQILSITAPGSQGMVAVPNPAFAGPDGPEPKTTLRDYGFGPTELPGTVTIGGVPAIVTSWSPGLITVAVAPGTSDGELVVTRGDNGKSTITGVTVTVGPIKGKVLSVPPGGRIQTVIDLAAPGDLVLVPPGQYQELVIMWKPLRLQGWGPDSTIINAIKAPTEKILKWRQKIQGIVESGAVDLLPSQEAVFGGIEPTALFTEEGAGIFVIAKDSNALRQGGFVKGRPARIDGFTITGADGSGGIIVNGHAKWLQISNNRVQNNQGAYGGGIRIGHPFLTVEEPNGELSYQDSDNDNIWIHHNHITQNGGLDGTGGGISIYTGADKYEVADNFICGNFTTASGGGIGHLGYSQKGRIERNSILFNENFNQGAAVNGGGIFIGGAPSVRGAGTLTDGSGHVFIEGNLIQGNAAGSGDGGAIRLEKINGEEVVAHPNNRGRWYKIDVLNNMMVNNVAALAGGGMSLQDAARTRIVHNTIANNDSTATAGEAFVPGNSGLSRSQPAGIVSRAHSDELEAAIGNNNNLLKFKEYSNPTLMDNIIWHNRAFYFVVDADQDPPFYGLIPDLAAGDAPFYWDLAVVGTATPKKLDSRFGILTDKTGYSSTNITDDPMFVAEYSNGARGVTIANPEITTAIQAPPAFDEGGNFIRLRFGPLTQTDTSTGLLLGDYHLMSGVSPAEDAGIDLTNTITDLLFDMDGDLRPLGLGVDIGADELP